MSPRDALSIGIDVGGTRIKAGLVEPDGTVVARSGRRTPGLDAGAAGVETAITGVAEELVAHATAHGRHVLSIGVGAAGLVDASRGTVVFAPHLSWREEPLQERLLDRLRRPVLVDNDAHAAAWGEHRFGAGVGETHLVVLTLGTGIGGAILTDGALRRGRHGLAGEFGHQQVVPDGHPCECGHRGCLEQYASGAVLQREGRRAVRLGGSRAAALTALCEGTPEALEGVHVTQAAAAGDAVSLAILAEVGRWLGVGLAGVVAALDPGTVIVGGGVSEAGDLLLEPARSALSERLVGRDHRRVPTVVPAQLGVDAGLVGAADLARTGAGHGGG